MNKKRYVNGTIITLDAENSLGAAMVTENGKIAYVGDVAGLPQEFLAEDCELVDLEGKVIIPGFYDSHGHIVGNAVVRWDLNKPIYPIGTTKSIAEIIEDAKEVAARKPEGDWIVVIGFDESGVEEKRALTRKDLDEVSLRHPVVVGNRSGHVIYLNTKAFEVCGITKETPDFPGGHYGKDLETGELNGAVEEKAALLIAHSHLPKPSVEEIIGMLRDVGDEYVKQGVTTANDAGFLSQGMMFFPLIENAVHSKVFKPRISVTHSYNFQGVDQFLEKMDQLPEPTDRLHMYDAVKCFYDGSIQARTAYVSEAYPNTEEKGYSVLTKEQLEELIAKCHRQDRSVILHCNGDQAIEDILDCFESVQKEQGERNVRHMLIHAQMITERQLDRLKALGLFVTFLPATFYYLGEEYLSNQYLSEEKTGNLNPMKWAVDREIPFAIHSDPQVYPQNPILSMHMAVNRETYKGRAIGSHQRISKLDALKAVTYYPAYQNMEEEYKGSLETGKVADFVVLDRNILEVTDDQIKHVEVVETVIAGETVYKK